MLDWVRVQDKYVRLSPDGRSVFVEESSGLEGGVVRLSELFASESVVAVVLSDDGREHEVELSSEEVLKALQISKPEES